jgi:hypothetical protein
VSAASRFVSTLFENAPSPLPGGVFDAAASSRRTTLGDARLQSARYDLIMKGFGGEAQTIERQEQVRPAGGRAFASGVRTAGKTK